MPDASQHQAAPQYQVGDQILFTWLDGTHYTGIIEAVVPPPGRVLYTVHLIGPRAVGHAQVTAAMITGKVAAEEEGEP